VAGNLLHGASARLASEDSLSAETSGQPCRLLGQTPSPVCGQQPVAGSGRRAERPLEEKGRPAEAGRPEPFGSERRVLVGIGGAEVVRWGDLAGGALVEHLHVARDDLDRFALDPVFVVVAADR